MKRNQEKGLGWDCVFDFTPIDRLAVMVMSIDRSDNGRSSRAVCRTIIGPRQSTSTCASDSN